MVLAEAGFEQLDRARVRIQTRIHRLKDRCSERLAMVSKSMGHSSISVTADIYRHVSPGSDQGLRDAIAKLDLPDTVSL